MSEETDNYIEKELTHFMSTGVPDDNPYWALFGVKTQMNDALVEAVKYGFREGMKNIPTVADRAEDAAVIRFLRHREEVLLNAVRYYVPGDDGKFNVDGGLTAQKALIEWDKVRL